MEFFHAHKQCEGPPDAFSNRKLTVYLLYFVCKERVNERILIGTSLPIVKDSHLVLYKEFDEMLQPTYAVT